MVDAIGKKANSNALAFIMRPLIGYCLKFTTAYAAIYCQIGNSLTSLITSHFVG